MQDNLDVRYVLLAYHPLEEVQLLKCKPRFFGNSEETYKLAWNLLHGCVFFS